MMATGPPRPRAAWATALALRRQAQKTLALPSAARQRVAPFGEGKISRVAGEIVSREVGDKE